jgi:hypothetical protein
VGGDCVHWHRIKFLHPALERRVRNVQFDDKGGRVWR